MAKILVVGGDAEGRDFLAGLLRSQGHQVLESSSCNEGMAIVRAALPDLIIADVWMPGMDGYEFARQLRVDAGIAHIRTILYTAGYHRGVDCVLPKPSEPEVILKAVDSVLRKPAHQDAVSRLNPAEQQYRTLFEMNPLPMWIVDEQSHRFLAVNQAAVRHYGYSSEEFERISLGDVLAAEDAATHLAEHRTKAGSLIDVAVFSQVTSFEGKRARLEIMHDVTERNRAERKLRESGEQLRRLTVRLRSAQEEERTRLARYLHDELGQMLTALRMTCGLMKARLPASQAGLAEKMQSCLKLTDEMMVAVQRLSTDLRPGILDIGVGAAIDWHVREFQTGSKIACTVEVPEDEEPVDPDCATEMFRIFQEVLTHIARQSGATHMRVALKREGALLLLEVYDNGRGVTPDGFSGHDAVGLLDMRERAASIGGTVSIEAVPESGTTVRITVPAGAVR